jgi:dTDP-4-amino-4,6-dideoxygalactose transaminase
MRAEIAEHIRLGRDYGNPGNYDTQFVGLNGRMSEMHAAVALASLECRPEFHEQRVAIANEYVRAFSGIPGIRTQHVDAGDTSTWKDFTIAVDADAFGTTRDALRRALAADGVDTRCYFDPPVHRQTAYADVGSPALPVTDAVASAVLSLPIYPALSAASVQRIAELVGAVRARADQVSAT